MTIETIQIQELASGEVTVKLIGDHDVTPDAPATTPYLLTAALFKLLQDGSAFKKVKDHFGIELEGTFILKELTA